MIPRYSRPEMTQIWEPANRFRIWYEIEAHACDAMAALGTIPDAAAKAVRERGALPYDAARIARIDAIERSEEHTSELQSLMRIPYAVFCLIKKIQTTNHI